MTARSSGCIFGIIVLGGADWIPGTLIVAASVTAEGLAASLPGRLDVGTSGFGRRGAGDAR